jgi:hypothetical protein
MGRCVKGLIVALVLILSPIICFSFPAGHGKKYNLPTPQIKDFRENNKNNFVRLKNDMSVDQVNEIMGTDKNVQTYYIYVKQKNLLSNPYSQKSIEKGGVDYLIYFYYTDMFQRDGKITEDELTPILFESGRLIGIGWDFCNKRLGEDLHEGSGVEEK